MEQARRHDVVDGPKCVDLFLEVAVERDGRVHEERAIRKAHDRYPGSDMQSHERVGHRSRPDAWCDGFYCHDGPVGETCVGS